MSGTFKDHFSGVAAGYQAFRPGQPAGALRLARRRDVEARAGSRPGLRHRPGVGGARGALRGGDRPRSERGADCARRAAPASALPRRAARGDGPPRRERGSGDCRRRRLHWFDPARLHPELSRIARPGAGVRRVHVRFLPCRVRRWTRWWSASIATSSGPTGRRSAPTWTPGTGRCRSRARDCRALPGDRGVVDPRLVPRVPEHLVGGEHLPREDGGRSARPRRRASCARRGAAGTQTTGDVESHRPRGTDWVRAPIIGGQLAASVR